MKRNSYRIRDYLIGKIDMAHKSDLLLSVGMDENDPALVLWSKSKVDGWSELEGHDCNGFSVDYLGGYVHILRPRNETLPLLTAIADEKFCANCD